MAILTFSGAPPMINVRKLAALDFALHGSKVITIEFAVGVGLPLAIGLLSLFRGHAVWQPVFGWYMISLGVNYVPLFLHAISIGSRAKAMREVESLGQGGSAARRYGRQSLLLLVPLVIPIAALVQAMRGSRKSPKGSA